NATGIKLFGAVISESDRTAEKRREAIGIPCPRCRSADTKFCYFNNYNVNQPRHYCRGCQRYWTAGGALRNVPIGAGRRKVKPPGMVAAAEAGEFVDGCFFDPSSVGFVGVEDWEEKAAEMGRFRDVFPAKRRRT
ncbi:hypothetical protein M569_02229, partial [Genlisea aurea]